MQKLLTILLIGFYTSLSANNVQISNLKLEDDNIISYNVSWENSWNYIDSMAPGNYDAVWLFVKGKKLSDAQWETVSLTENEHDVSANYTFEIANNQLGKMVFRSISGDGISNIEVTSQLNVDVIIEKYSELRVFAIEMVYVTAGSFYIGDSLSNNTLINSMDSSSYFVESENEIVVGQEVDGLWVNGDFPPARNISSIFPKGYDGFYCMKYEISQEQYADFLNTLTETQIQSRKLITSFESLCFTPEDHIDGERNFIVEIDGVFGCDANQNNVFGDIDDGDNVACNFLTWADLTAYLDWSGLRPMTELEYEKASRGPIEPVPLEYVWGTSETINTLLVNLTATPTETTSDIIPLGAGIANFGYCLPSGPLRCGFAAKEATSRLESGASYYGIMEMSGNLWEMCIALSDQGLNFQGNHGDGNLSLDGNSDEILWDAIIGEASGFRGGGWNSGILSGFRDLAISDRFFAFLNGNSQNRGTTGGRGVISKSMFE